MNKITKLLESIYFSILGSGSIKYRKRKGGTWYFVQDMEGAGGNGGPITYWTQEHIEEYELKYILRAESYPSNTMIDAVSQ